MIKLYLHNAPMVPNAKWGLHRTLVNLQHELVIPRFHWSKKKIKTHNIISHSIALTNKLIKLTIFPINPMCICISLGST